MVQLLCKATKFNWDEKCKEILQQLNDFFSSPAVIQKLIPDQPIVVYLAISKEAVSVVLVQEMENEEQPVYFINWTLHATKTRY